MTVLQIEFSEGTGDLVAVAELVDSELEVRQAPMASDSPAQFDVEAGAYQLSVRWSDGRTDKRRLAVGANDLVVPIDPPNTQPPDLLSLGDPVSIGELTPRFVDTVDQALLRLSADTERTYLRQEPRGMKFSFESGRANRAIEHFATRDDLLRFTVWRKTDGAWKTVGLDAMPRDIPGGIEFEVHLNSGLHLFEVSGRGQNQYVSIPAEHAIVALRWVRIGERRHLRVDARTTDPAIESLRGYIARGNVDLARGLAPNVLAERSLNAKIAAPRIAALGAYFLLRVGDFDRLHDWPDNLSNWQPWLPDGPVISAWQRLRSPDPDLDVVRRLLLEAESRGMPIYTEGVRLLKDGLELFARDPEADWDVEEPHRRVEAYAMAMDWRKSETTYAGDHPDKPRPAIASSEISWDADDSHAVHLIPDAEEIELARPLPADPGAGADRPSGETTPSTVSKEAPVKSSVGLDGVLRSAFVAGSPFLGRAFLRQSVSELLRTDGPEILVVNGPRGSGKSFTLQFIDQIAQRTAAFRVAHIDAHSVSHPKFGAQQLVQAFAVQMGVPFGDIPTRESSKHYPGVLAAWLLRQAWNSGSTWWWVLDDFSSAGRPAEVRLLMNELARMLGDHPGRNRLVLLDFDEPLPADVEYRVLREHLPDPNQIGSREVQAFLHELLRQSGMTTTEEDIDNVASAFLTRIPAGADRLAQLNLLMVEFTQIVTKKKPH